jgi:hypothetical protein
MDVFKSDPTDTTDNTPKFEDLVGEGKKYKDQEAAAKAIHEKDRFIERLLEEKREVEAALAKRNNEEEFLARLETIARPQPTPAPATTPEPEGKGAALTPEAIDEIVAKRLAEREAKSRAEQNLALVSEKLQGQYGASWKAQVQHQAQSLGVDTEYMTQIAAQNPQAFFRLMGVDQQPKIEPMAPPRSQFSPAPSGGQKDYQYYKRLREEKGEAWYFSKPVQREIWERMKADPNFLTPKG